MRKTKITESITVRQSESFKKYLTDISNIKMFETPQDEADCAELARSGDKRAFDELVRRNLRFVVSIAKQYSGNKLSLEDLVNEGNLGLIEAAKRFDPTKGNKFISHAVWWIRKEIMDYISTNKRQVRVPNNKLSAISRLNGKINAIEQELGRPAYSNDIMGQVDGLKIGEVNSLLELSNSTISSMDKPINENGSTIHDITPSNDYTVDDFDIVKSEQNDNLNKLLNSVDEKSVKILKMYFGVDCDYAMNLNDIGKKMGISRERVRQIKESALIKLSKSGHNMGIEEFNF